MSDSCGPMVCVACQAPLSMGFCRREYCRGLPFPSPADLCDPGIKPGSPALQADSLPSELHILYIVVIYVNSGLPIYPFPPDPLSEVKSLSCIRLFVTPWTVAQQAPPSMGFSRQEHWSGCLPFPSPGDLPHPGIELRSPALRADALTSEPPGTPW